MRAFTLCIIASAVAATFGWTACSSSTCADDNSCDPFPPGDGGDSGNGDGAPPGCDPNADPKDAPLCVVSEFGVFVDAAGGLDTNAGTTTSPLKTIGAALGKVGGNKQRIYLCGEGPYAEAVKLTSAVSIFGGFACGTWKHAGTKSKLARPDEGVALEVRNVPAPIVLADLDVEAKDATAASGSSIAMFVVASSKVTLRRVAARAGIGKDGTNATDQQPFMPASAAKGNDGSAGGKAKENTACPTSIGGAGGEDGSPNGESGKVEITPRYPSEEFSGVGGITGSLSCTNGVGLGKNGSYGNGGPGGAGATKIGSLTTEGWKPNDGTAGAPGNAGQGGGGGARLSSGGVGGSGGPGGCGGKGGDGGTGGGASIAVAILDSAVLLEQSSLFTKNAGNGGRGGKGQKAQLPSDVQSIGNGSNACAGGFGGVGGSGGGGGGGGGGISVGILYKGTTPPTLDGSPIATADTSPSITTGQKGSAGTKGTGGDVARQSPVSHAGKDASDAIGGIAAAILAVP